MTMSFNVKALGAFKKLGAAALITATLAMCFTACNQTGGGGGGGKQGAPFVEGGASLILSPDKLTIKVKAITADGSAIAVEGCTETTLANDTETTLTATGTTVILKGKITELNCYGNKLTELNVQGLTFLKKLWCSDNQLTELNVQGLTALQKLDCFYNEQLTELNIRDCTALKKLYCYHSKLNAQAMTEILNALPAREEGDKAEANLYSEYNTSVHEGNCKDYTQPAELKAAFDGAKSRNWKLQKKNYYYSSVDI